MSWSDWLLPKGFQTSNEASANAAAQKAKLAAQDAKLGEYDRAINNSAISTPLLDQDAETASAFRESIGESLTKAKDAVTGFGPLKLIPAWVWIVTALALFFYCGGHKFLKRKLA